MKKSIFSLFAALAFTVTAMAQKAPADAKVLQMNVEMKTALVSKLKLNDAAAGKVVAIETEFHQRLASIAAILTMPAKDKEAKLNEAHTARRAALMALPMTSRAMEDAVEIADRLWSKYHP